jgi:ATP-dependent Clp protease ATP-binding subunit ClpA
MDEYFSRDLTQLAADGRLGPFCGRGRIIDQAIAVLSQDGKANLVLTGEPGVGKTAIVEAIALSLSQDNSPAGLRAIHIKELDTNALVAGTVYRGQFEAKAKALVDYLRTHRDVVVFVDEIHALLGVGSDENMPSPFANFLKPYLARGEIRMIGVTTNHEFEVMNRKDAALTRRFVRINVPEPTREEAIGIVRQLGVQRSANSGIALDAGVIEAVVDAGIRYVHDRRLPDKAIDLLTACKLQDGMGKTCFFSQSLVMLTSNVCAELIGKLDPSDIANRYEDIRGQVTGLLKSHSGQKSLTGLMRLSSSRL